MAGGLQRDASLALQTWALIKRNALVQWRTSVYILEWIQYVLMLLILYFMLGYITTTSSGTLAPAEVLGPLDKEITASKIGYMANTSTTQEIMQRVNQRISSLGISLRRLTNNTDPNNETTTSIWFRNGSEYHMKFNMTGIFDPGHYQDNRGDCESKSSSCYPLSYWRSGYLLVQAAINSAIMEWATNHSMWSSMAATEVVKMKSVPSTGMMVGSMGWLIICICMTYSILLYSLTMHVTKDRNNMKEILRMMGLKDLAFWFSWGLPYTVYAIIISIFLTLVLTKYVFTESSAVVIFLPICLYGVAMVCFSLMLSAIYRKPRLTANAGFFITFFLSALGILPLVIPLPKALEVGLSIFHTFSLAVALAESMHMESDLQGVFFSDLPGDASHVLFSCIYLAVDSLLYIALTFYFDKVIPDNNGMRHEPFFFLRCSFWSRSKMSPVPLSEQDIAAPDMEDYVEKVPAEFLGKEAIRIYNIKKTYSGEDKNTEALRGLYLDVYEGQIMALLGHNSAGKTTLLNILSGMCRASSGSITIYNEALSDISRLTEIQKKIGFCPQSNVMFDYLTVRENLEIFAAIKGISKREIKTQVEKVLVDLEIGDLQQQRANKLSGGQKRKLTLAIALLGDPEILLLDEPTAGLDLSSRYHVWSMLKEHKAGRVILFSTQFMDEADILADRKAVLSNGRLKCIGSSFFLKRKWGIGYYLRMQRAPSCDTEAIISLIQQHITSAKVITQSGEDLMLSLPFETVDRFPALFSDLDGRVGQDIVTYGVSISTLDDVFLKLEGVTDSEQGDRGGPTPERKVSEDHDNFCSDPEESILLMPDSDSAALTGMALWRQQLVAMARVRFLKLKSDAKGVRSILILLVLFTLTLILITQFLGQNDSDGSWELTPHLYFRRPGDRTHKYYTSLLVNNNTGSPIENFIKGICSQEIEVEMVNGPYDPNTTAYNGAIEVSPNDKDFRFRIIGNPKAQNGLPVLVNVISNAFLWTYNSTNLIRVWNHPILNNKVSYFAAFAVTVKLMLIVYAPGLTPYFAMTSLEDFKIRARSQLRVAGLFPSAFWLGQAMVDVVLYWLLLFLMVAILFAFDRTIQMPYTLVLAIVAEVLGYGAAMVLFTYIVGLVVVKKKGSDQWSFLFIIAALLPATIYALTNISRIYFTFLLLCFPPSTLTTFIFHLGLSLSPLNDGGPGPELYSQLTLPYFHIVAFLFILKYAEDRYGQGCGSDDPVFRLSKKQPPFKSNPEDLKDADPGVLAERERVKVFKRMDTSAEKPVIIADSLRKEFEEASGKFTQLCPGKKKTRVATRNISFCVKKGEILGLLGPNGAGKTTSVLIMAGEMMPTAGQVLYGTSDLPEDTGSLGYCPQHNPLWPTLTMKEHLEIYAAIRGVNKNDINSTVQRLAEALEMKDHLNKPAKKLSGGVSSKVCFALSMLGNPTIALLDEPSTGLDPKGQQRLWQAIRTTFKNKKRGAILTTHYMDEAEAVCDRVAIMVSGKLRCIGSIQHLKSAFGKGYLLELKLRDTEQVDVIHGEILQIFPQAAKQDRFSTLLVYKIPLYNVPSLSEAFLRLENAKKTYGIEEYSFSQSTLEQVFLELTQEQAKEDLLQESSLEGDKLRSERV